MPATPRAVLFDLDGTLVDSLEDIAAALNRALEKQHSSPATVADVRRWVGDGITMLCRRAAPQAGEDALVALRADFTDAYQKCCLDRTRLYPGVAATLETLFVTHVPMAVLSNKRDEFTRTIVAALCAPNWFRAVRGVRSDAERKPSPVLALELARQMDVPPAQTFFVGDGIADLQAARAAGMIPVAVTWGFGDADELRRAGPDYLIDRIEQLVELAVSAA